MNDLEQILHGTPPTEVFRQIVAAEPGLENHDLALRFVDYFERVDWESLQVIWHWQRPGGRPDLPDEGVNESLIALLRKAGYVIVR